MAQQNDTVQFSTLWAAVVGWTKDQQISFVNQIRSRLRTMPLAHVQDVLNQAPTHTKVQVWAEWANGADLSGHSLPDILSLNDTEPPTAVYSIVTKWLEQVDLSKYDLATVKRTAGMLRGADIPKLWGRWVNSADLSAVNLVSFCKSIQDLSPEYQAIVLTGFIAHANMVQYSSQDKDAAAKYISAYAAGESGLKESCKVLYPEGTLVRVLSSGFVGRVTKITDTRGLRVYTVSNVVISKESGLERA